MKAVVIFKSSTGFTKQYAQWIAKELNTEAVDIKKIDSINLNEYDSVIFGGWVMANTIAGLNKIRKLNIRNLIVFAVGAALDNEEIQEAIISTNKLQGVPFFYMPGGIKFDKHNFFVRFMLKKIVQKKEEEESNQDMNNKRKPVENFDNSGKKYIDKLIAFVREN